MASAAKSKENGSAGKGTREWLTLVVALMTAGVAVYPGAVSSRSATGTLKISQRQLEISNQIQVTERLARSTEQLGAPTTDVRIGAIFSLDRLAHDSPSDRAIIKKILAAYVRQHVRQQLIETGVNNDIMQYLLAVDVAIAVDVLSGRSDKDIPPLADLQRVNLKGVDLSARDLSYMYFYRADLTDANLFSVDFTGPSGLRV